MQSGSNSSSPSSRSITYLQLKHCVTVALPCREAANAKRFSKLFSFMPEVVVPHMYTEYTTPRVLVMEWIEGERLRTASQQAPAVAAAAAAAAAGLQRQHAAQVKEDLRLVEIGVRCSLEQMLEEGFYHAGKCFV